MRILTVIPARFGSTRFPGKPLIDIHGKTMIRRVLERASAATCPDRVIVATDDKRIAEAVRDAGGEAVMTSDEHTSGTDRVAEVALAFRNDYDIVINLQGDEPYVNPAQIDELCTMFDNPDVQIGTLIRRIENDDDIFNPNKPKVVTDLDGKALYFSRAPLPFIRKPEEGPPPFVRHFMHIGIYGYRIDVLEQLVALPPSSLELAECLEQLRWLENGFGIYCRETEFESWSVDVPEDIYRLPEEPD